MTTKNRVESWMQWYKDINHEPCVEGKYNATRLEPPFLNIGGKRSEPLCNDNRKDYGMLVPFQTVPTKTTNTKIIVVSSGECRDLLW